MESASTEQNERLRISGIPPLFRSRQEVVIRRALRGILLRFPFRGEGVTMTMSLRPHDWASYWTRSFFLYRKHFILFAGVVALPQPGVAGGSTPRGCLAPQTAAGMSGMPTCSSLPLILSLAVAGSLCVRHRGRGSKSSSGQLDQPFPRRCGHQGKESWA